MHEDKRRQGRQRVALDEHERFHVERRIAVGSAIVTWRGMRASSSFVDYLITG